MLFEFFKGFRVLFKGVIDGVGGGKGVESASGEGKGGVKDATSWEVDAWF